MSNPHPHRRKMCADCAFRKQSLEMNSPERKGELIAKCETSTFFCHQTMFNLQPENGEWLGNYDEKRKPDGSPAELRDHQICAGFAAMYRPRIDVDYTDIDINGHAFENMIRSDMATESEVRAMSDQKLESLHA